MSDATSRRPPPVDVPDVARTEFLFQRTEERQRALFGPHALPAGWAPYRWGQGWITVAKIDATQADGIASIIEELRAPVSFIRLTLQQVSLGPLGVSNLVVLTGTGEDLAKVIYQVAQMAACGALVFDLPDEVRHAE